jgi:hypothetical protein
VVDDKFVYFTNSGEMAQQPDGKVTLKADSGNLSKVPKTGGAATLLADKQYAPEGIAQDLTRIYWADTLHDKILSLPK